MSRGDLRWSLTLTEDGHLPGDGLIPFLIRWGVTSHPALAMPESGCSLLRLEGFHPQREALFSALQSLGAERLMQVRQSEAGTLPRLVSFIETPGGVKTLS